MKDIYLLHHSFNNDDGSLDARGKQRALDIARLLPPLAVHPRLVPGVIEFVAK